MKNRRKLMQPKAIISVLWLSYKINITL